jgi:glycosyltransferase involved in cell wall biosynthesis
MINPKITVLMLAYNSSKYITQSIKSILRQSYNDFEFLIVYDESVDNTFEIINEYAVNDARIKIIKNENSRGIVGAANTGLKYAAGEYVARLDSDDIALPDRLEKQIAFMEKNNEFGLLGGNYKLIDENNNFIKSIKRLNFLPDKIPSVLFFENYFVQSSVMIRKKVLDDIGFYSEDIPSCEDYELWIRISEKYKTWNLPEVLVLYRIHDDSDTLRKVDIRKNMLYSIYTYQLRKFGVDYSKEELDLHIMIYNNNFIPQKEIIMEIKNWLIKLFEYNNIKNIYPKQNFNEVLSDKWFDICYFCSKFTGIWTYNEYFSFSIYKYSKINFFRIFKFFLKCIMRK